MLRKINGRSAPRYLKVFLLTAAVALGVPGLALAADPTLVGRWTFSDGNDSTGHWGPLMLVGSASISNGKLVVTSNSADTQSESAATGWAYATGYNGPTISDKTLISWVTVDDISTGLGGSPIGLYKPCCDYLNDNFDSIDYGEVGPYWMAGSDYFLRTHPDASGTVMDNPVGHLRQVAISYKANLDGSQTITGCLDGTQKFQYATGKISFDQIDNPKILFGPRHLRDNAYPHGSLNAHIDAASLYDRALSCTEVAALSRPVPTNKDQCKGGGWQSLFRADGTAFENQGDCIQYVNTGK